MSSRAQLLQAMGSGSSQKKKKNKRKRNVSQDVKSKLNVC